MASYAGVRGIRNVSGVSCHISSALQVIYHGLPELRQALIHLADASGGGCGRDEDNDGADAPLTSAQFVYQLGLLFKILSSKDMGVDVSADEVAATPAVDPMALYDVLPSSLNYRDVGDSATALRVILTTIRLELEELRNSKLEFDKNILKDTSNLLDACLCGSTVQRIEGTMRTIEVVASGKKISKLVKRRKPDKERKLTVPFPIPIKGYSCLYDALASVTTDAQAINGYDWETVDEYEQSEMIVDDDDDDDDDGNDDDDVNEEEDSVSSDSSSESSDPSSSDSSSDTSSSSSSYSYSSSSSEEEVGVWKTNKYSLLNEVPQYLLLHLKRFEYRCGQVQKLSSVLDVPKKLDIVPYSTNSQGGDGEYELFAGIVHIDEPIEVATNDIDEDAGHYVSYVRLGQECKGDSGIDSIDAQMEECKISENTTQWVEINDEKVTAFDGETGKNQVLNVLSGRYFKKEKAGGHKKGSKYATILLYRRTNTN